jgi:hypothetical protein
MAAYRKELQELIKNAEKQGWIVSANKNNHYKWTSPGGAFFFSASTPSDWRALKYIVQYLRKYGFEEQGSKKSKGSK